MRDWLKRLLIGPGGAMLAATPALAQSGAVVTHDNWWLPPQAAAESAPIDTMFDVIFVITVVTMIAVFAVLIYFLVKYRYRPERRATFLHGHHQAEVIWTVTPAVILVVMGILSIRAWGHLRMDKPGPEVPATNIEVLAQQFQWNFRYPGKDGRFGTKDDVGTFDVEDTLKSPLVGVFNVPVNKVVRVHLMSKDVLHSFFLPNVRMKLDAVPGLRGELWFTPTKVGSYDLACAELCGPQHYTMRGQMNVLSQEDYDQWIKEREEEVASQIGEEPAEETPAPEEPAKEEAPKETEKPAAKTPAVKEAPAAPTITESAEEGVIKGKVSFEGTAPKPRTFDAGGDAHCKREHPQGIELQTVKVKDGGLADVFVQIKSGLPKDKKWDVPKEPVVLNQKGCEYYPHTLAFMAGQELKITNEDSTAHNIHGLPKLNTPFNLAQSAKGSENILKGLNKPEQFKIKCDVHNWMGANAFVMSHPFFATSDEAGNFQIRNVPPGTYDVELWHETLGTKTINGLKIEPGKGIQAEVKFAPKSGGK